LGTQIARDSGSTFGALRTDIAAVCAPNLRRRRSRPQRAESGETGAGAETGDHLPPTDALDEDACHIIESIRVHHVPPAPIPARCADDDRL
jgi:hypothetical protein